MALRRNSGRKVLQAEKCEILLKDKIEFLTFGNPIEYPDITLIPVDAADRPSAEVSTHKFVLASRSPVFKVMFESEMEESRCRTIKIRDVSYKTLYAFVCFLYKGEIELDKRLSYKLLALAEKYQVAYLKVYCEKYLISNLKLENALQNYAFANQYNAKTLLGEALVLIVDNMGKLSNTEQFKDLEEKDPRMTIELLKAYVSKNTHLGTESSGEYPRPLLQRAYVIKNTHLGTELSVEDGAENSGEGSD